jgi:hypothetical protein
MLGRSRSQRASIAKLHILNDAIRSNAPDKLQAIVEGTASTLPWNLRVEPAFARAIDFAVGDKLAAWTRTAGRAALQLTVDGSTAFESISKMPDALTSEKEVLGAFSKSVTESVVTAVLGSGRKAP